MLREAGCAFGDEAVEGRNVAAGTSFSRLVQGAGDDSHRLAVSVGSAVDLRFDRCRRRGKGREDADARAGPEGHVDHCLVSLEDGVRCRRFASSIADANAEHVKRTASAPVSVA